MPTVKNQKPSDKASSNKKPESSGIGSKAKLQGRGRPAGIKNKKAQAFSKDESIGIYIFRILKQTHPEIGISKIAVSTVNSLLIDLYKNISRTAVEISKKGKGRTLTARDIQSATKLCLPGELAEHAVSEGAAAVTKHKVSMS